MPKPRIRAGHGGGEPAPAPLVIKLGGRALESPGAGAELAGELLRHGARTVIAHGGGAEVSAWCARFALEPRFADGLRVTDPGTLEVAAAVLAGLANKRLVAMLRAQGVDAIGLSALDGGIVEAAPHADAARLGAVGEVVDVVPQLLETLLDQGRTPVLASIAAHDGRLLNLNADELACALAGALCARALILLSDTPGLKIGGDLVARVPANQIEGMLAHPDVQGGMRPKLRAAAAAIRGGARRVVIGAWAGPGSLEALLTGGSGTTFLAETLEDSRV
jgi:acetylglutamate kinase